ncbi:MAG: hypothetical protein ACLQIB_18690 [Isosphaeraceae bacterium]
MSYNKVQAFQEFSRWSDGYDRCILQPLLFGPSHRATGYGLLSDFGPSAEGTDGPTLRHLRGRSRQWHD